ncbi:CpsD/CapB family tyrosine-protein kinase [Oscillochloris sp. ZM17-4]|uniref:CpsD/CapB family tyrosine-protein kinase n=1 Tax=Oscillochloris sp. ZM17-4 TaxID=2866714 RepID=UPI001C7362C6|nr:CpsD/CapB family tyrosine-protein kinase [Oscillochloris sp. ZM17-4]MBX0328822.1 CpsD/CapB family tyrosine-protein kinase [Oscillochloris sp. ZM17-4]
MSKRQKKNQGVDVDHVLTVRSTDGILQRTFDADVIQSFRYMSTELTLNGDLPRSVAVIAALRGEGVTHTAVALGATLAHDTGASVCVVELNWWSPGQIALLDPKVIAEAASKKRRKTSSPSSAEPALASHPGLAMVVSGEVSLDDAIIHSDMPNFDLLPAGELSVAKRPSMARSAALRELMKQLSARYDHLILDVPAVRTTSDSIVLASLGDACIVVTRQGATSTASVQQALDDVKSLTMLGVVLNKVTIKTPGWIRALVPQE